MAWSRHRVFRLVAAVLLCCAVLAFVWPLHALASRYHPVILGVPFSLAWIVVGQVTVFLGLLLMFLGED